MKSVTIPERPVEGGHIPKFFEEKTFAATELSYKGAYPNQSRRNFRGHHRVKTLVTRKLSFSGHTPDTQNSRFEENFENTGHSPPKHLRAKGNLS